MNKLFLFLIILVSVCCQQDDITQQYTRYTGKELVETFCYVKEKNIISEGDGFSIYTKVEYRTPTSTKETVLFETRTRSYLEAVDYLKNIHSPYEWLKTPLFGYGDFKVTKCFYVKNDPDQVFLRNGLQEELGKKYISDGYLVCFLLFFLGNVLMFLFD